MVISSPMAQLIPKCGGHTMNAKLRILFNNLRKKDVLPVGWGSSEVVNLYKEGDKTDPGNYSGIALISCLGKIYLSLWAKRLATSLEPELSEEQGDLGGGEVPSTRPSR